MARKRPYLNHFFVIFSKTLTLVILILSHLNNIKFEGSFAFGNCLINCKLITFLKNIVPKDQNNL